MQAESSCENWRFPSPAFSSLNNISSDVKWSSSPRTETWINFGSFGGTLPNLRVSCSNSQCISAENKWMEIGVSFPVRWTHPQWIVDWIVGRGALNEVYVGLSVPSLMRSVFAVPLYQLGQHYLCKLVNDREIPVTRDYRVQEFTALSSSWVRRSRGGNRKEFSEFNEHLLILEFATILSSLNCQYIH